MSLKNPVTPPGIDPGTVRPVAQCLNHYATPGPICCLVLTIYKRGSGIYVSVSRQEMGVSVPRLSGKF